MLPKLRKTPTSSCISSVINVNLEFLVKYFPYTIIIIKCNFETFRNVQNNNIGCDLVITKRILRIFILNFWWNLNLPAWNESLLLCLNGILLNLTSNHQRMPNWNAFEDTINKNKINKHLRILLCLMHQENTTLKRKLNLLIQTSKTAKLRWISI